MKKQKGVFCQKNYWQKNKKAVEFLPEVTESWSTDRSQNRGGPTGSAAKRQSFLNTQTRKLNSRDIDQEYVLKNIFQKEKEALVLEKSGDWDGAHQIVQRLETTEAQRIHAYLHRKEGDLSNAAYWYARAGVEKCSGSFDAEWEMLKELVR